MRLIHKIKTILNSKCCIWPFESCQYLDKSNITIVEIFPSYYFHYQSKLNKQRWKAKNFTNDTLSFYDQKFISKLSLERMIMMIWMRLYLVLH